MVIKKEQKEYLLSLLPDHNFERIEDNVLIQWEEQGKEFRYKNQMYDVARTIFINGKKTYLVINDSKENKLLQKMEQAVSTLKDNNSTKGGHAAVLKYIQSIFIFDPITNISAMSRLKNTYLIFNEPLSSDFVKNIQIPPPQIF